MATNSEGKKGEEKKETKAKISYPKKLEGLDVWGKRKITINDKLSLEDAKYLKANGYEIDIEEPTSN